MKIEGFCFDLESDGFVFESTRIWTVWVKDLNNPNKKIKLNPFKDKQAKSKFINFIKTYEGRPHVVFHNGLGFDIFILRTLMGVDFKVGKRNGDEIEGIPIQFVDTFYWSMYLFPDRSGHSIESFGDKLGLEKIDFRKASIDGGIIDNSSERGDEFKQHSLLMDEYCERDVDVNILVFKYLLKEHKALYGNEPIASQAFKCGQKSFFLMSCQEYTGFKFDIDKAKNLYVRIEGMMEEIRAEVEPQLPPRDLGKTEQKEYTLPAKPFLKNGDLSQHMLNFIKKHNGEVLENGKILILGKEYPIGSQLELDIKVPMKMANQTQMKEWLVASGWIPTLWNFKRDKDGKPFRDPTTRQLVKTSPKMQEQGKLCPNLEEMEGELVKKVVRWLSLRNRSSVLRGWLENPRLEYDGRLSGRRSGIAATHRQKHAVIANVPKADPKVLLGQEFRELFCCENGMVIAAADASGLEARVQGHFAFKYDGGDTARVLLEGDVHSATVKRVYAEDPRVAETDIFSDNFDKESDFWKPLRNRSKNIYYGVLYGCAAPKAASLAGFPESKGQQVVDAFWEVNSGTKALKDALEGYWNITGKKKFLPAIDGRILHTRKKSALLNTIFQSCGGILMDYACCFMDMWLGDIHFDELRRPYYLYKGKLVRRIIYYHDEYSFECDPEIAEEISKMLEKAIEKAGELTKIKVPLTGEGKVGLNWKETH